MANPYYQGLSEFRKATPPSFHGDYNPILAKKWVMQLEKIFTVIGCVDFQKVLFATYMLVEEVEHRWRGAKSLLEFIRTEITQEVFLTIFFDKYILDSVKNEKDTEFIQLKQGSMTISQYVAKFDELSKFSSYLKK